MLGNAVFSLTSHCLNVFGVFMETETRESKAQKRKNAFEDFFESPDTLALKSELAQCEVCNNSMSKYSLRRHMKTVHGARGRKWECSDCGKCFSHVSHLHRHKRIHTGKYNLFCWLRYNSKASVIKLFFLFFLSVYFRNSPFFRRETIWLSKLWQNIHSE